MALRCPKCPDGELRQPGSGTPVLRCYACSGMWVSVTEAEQLALAGNLIDPTSLVPKNDPEDHRTGMCPGGHGVLTRARVEVDEPFFLERCSTCHGIWFDDGEWRKLASSHLLHHLNDLWDTGWQRRMRTEQAEAKHRERLSESLGPHIVAAIEKLAELVRSSENPAAAVAYFLDRVN